MIARSGDPAWDGLRFELDDPRVPEEIRRGAREIATAGDWFTFADTDEGGEWWLFDAEGTLIEAFWLE